MSPGTIVTHWVSQTQTERLCSLSQTLFRADSEHLYYLENKQQQNEQQLSTLAIYYSIYRGSAISRYYLWLTNYGSNVAIVQQKARLCVRCWFPVLIHAQISKLLQQWVFGAQRKTQIRVHAFAT